MTRRIESLATMAAQIEQPLAPAPFTHYADGTHHLADRIQIDYDDIEASMQPYDMPNLKHMLISVHPHQTLPQTDRSAKACVYTTPWIHQNYVYYPHIALGVHAARPNSAQLNDSLRHELWHLTQENVALPYCRPRNIAALRGVGIAALAGSIATTVEASTSHDPRLYGFTAGLALIGAISVAMPDSLLSYFSSQEVEARQFARENQDFAPILLTP